MESDAETVDTLWNVDNEKRKGQFIENAKH